jgi:hypothetical protein
MALQLGPVTVGFMIPQCPQQAQRSMLQPRELATIRQRTPGGMIDCPILLVGPLPKGALSEQITNSGSSMADIRRHIHNVCRQEIHTLDVRLVGRYYKGRSPMFPIHGVVLSCNGPAIWISAGPADAAGACPGPARSCWR